MPYNKAETWSVALGRRPQKLVRALLPILGAVCLTSYPTRADPPPKGDAEHGATLFSRYCRGCHGVDGQGDGLVFMPHVNNLTKKGYIESLPDDSRAAPPDTAATPEEGRNLEKWSSFHEAIDRLPDKERIIIELSFYEGLTQNEMARVLGVDEKTVRRRWKRATANLVARLGEDVPR